VFIIMGRGRGAELLRGYYIGGVEEACAVTAE
jgi:hypothetical protein